VRVLNKPAAPASTAENSAPLSALFFSVVVSIALSGCGSAPTAPRNPEPAATPVARNIPSRLSVDQANDVTLYAISLVGTPYRYGGNTPESGFDCSGLIGHVYKARSGVVSPRTVASLKDWGQPVTSGEVRTGDLVVFSVGGATSHAGIYVGEGRFVHAPSTGGTVRLEPLTSKYWAKQQVAFRRP
jgi:cell wall-associated NlpC family hydrolase